jgi:hypothetical protein
MADRMIYISWGAPVAGREERGLEVFNESMGLYGRMQQEGRIESFDVGLMVPNGGGPEGFISLRGSAEQLAAIKEDEEYLRTMTDASLIIQDLSIVDGYVNEGVAQQMEIYQGAIGRVPQTA